MSLLLFMDSAGKALATTGIPVAADPYIAGLRYRASDNALFVQQGFAPASAPKIGGIARDNQGVMYVTLEATPGVPCFNSGGVLTDVTGTVYGTLNNAQAGSNGGNPVDSAGRILFAPAGFGPAAMFDAPLTTTLVPVTAGNPVFTFTRATPAYVKDCDSILRQAIPNEARFQGARRVRNVVGNSENFVIGASTWLSDFGTVTVTLNDTLAPDGTMTADKVVFGANAGNGSWMFIGTGAGANKLSGATPDNLGYRGSVYAKGTAGQTFNIWTRTTIGSNESVAHITLTGGWDRITPSGTTAFDSANVPTLCFGTRNLDIAVGTADTVWVWGAQLEAVSGAANQAPGDYVSCGVLAAPYHGNGVDGVQYFGTTNGNSVAANIVTEAAGTAIPAANLLGYVAENQATNLCLQSQTFDNAAWTKSGAAIVADNFSAPDGSQTADRFTDDATNAFHRIIQNAGMTIVSGTVYTYSVYAKAGSLTWLQLATAVGTVRWANFNLVTGALGNKEAGTTAKIEALPVGWYRCSITWTADNTSVIPIIYSLGSDVAGTGGSYIGSSQNMFVWGAQVEQASDASSYVSTTTASVTRNEDNLRYPMLSNLDGATGTTYAESYFPGAWLGKQAVVLAHSANNGYSQYYEIPKTFGIYPPPSAQFLTANARTVGAVNKSTTAWSGASASACLNGGAVATGAYGAYPNSGNVIVGGAGYATVQGSIRNVRFYATRLTDVQLQALTT